ncbi:MAG: cell division protein FtsX [Cyclobacteriaceae bacterium]
MSKYKSKKNLGSYPYVSVVLSVMLALFVIGLFGILMLFTTKLTDNIRSNIQMQVFLQKYTTENDRIKLTRMISGQPFVAKENDKALVTFISKEKAAEDFIKDTGEDFIQFLGENPLRDAFVINIDPTWQHADSLKMAKTTLAKLDGVYEVSYVESLVDAINKNLSKISFGLLVLAVLLVVTITILINNTIKLALFSQRFLIRSMQLVGATSTFITMPFLRRSMMHGAVAGIIASAALFGLLNYANMKIPELELLQDTRELQILFALLITAGVLIMVISTYNAVNKYLKMSLDELY